MIKHIVFDWDDTISIGSLRAYFKIFHNTLVDIGVELEPEVEKERILRRWGGSIKVQLQELLAEHPEKLDKAVKVCNEHLYGGDFHKEVSVPGGIDKLLRRLSRNYILSVASGAYLKLINQTIDMFDIPKVFMHIMSAQEIADPEKHKPHPYMLQELMKHTNTLPKEMVYVCDAKNDYLMTMRAGVTPVIVLSGHLTRSEAEQSGAQYIIEDVMGIEKVLKEIDPNPTDI